MTTGWNSRICGAAGVILAMVFGLIDVRDVTASITYSTIALTGTDGPLGPNLGAGVHFGDGNFGTPVLNAAGEVAFTGTLIGTDVNSTNREGVWTTIGGTLAVVAREGTSGTLGPNLGAGVNFVGFSDPVLNNAGEVSFLGSLTGTGVNFTNDRGIWTTIGGIPDPVALEGAMGTAGPDLGFGVAFEMFYFTQVYVFNDTGELAFWGSLTGSGIDSTNNNGVWRTTGGIPALVARKGDSGPGPGLAAGVNFGFFTSPVLNTTGEIAFHGGLTGAGVDSSNDRGVWSDAGGTLAIVARSGSAGPGPDVGLGVNFSDFSSPVINNAGDIAFYGTLTGTGVDSSNGNGIWSNAGGTLAVVARAGSDGPGPGVGTGVNFSDFAAPVINTQGNLAFFAGLAGTGVDSTNNLGIWTTTEGIPVARARSGTDGPLGPNLGAGINFSTFNFPVINATGEIAFFGLLTGAGVDSSNDIGLWATLNGDPVNIIREGDLFDVDPGPGVDMRTISDFRFLRGVGGEDGRGLSFNDAGMLTFRLNFTDGSSGIFTASTQLPGDLNGDGFVGIADLNAILSNWNQNVTPGDPLAGDPTGDGFVGIADLNAVLGNWNAGSPPGAPGAESVIPEPGTAAVIWVGAGVILRRRGTAC